MKAKHQGNEDKDKQITMDIRMCEVSKHINANDVCMSQVNVTDEIGIGYMGLLNSLVCFGDFLKKSFCQYFGKEFSFLMLEFSKLPGGSYCESPYFLDVLIAQSFDDRRLPRPSRSLISSFLRCRTLSWPSLSSQSSGMESSSWWYECDEGSEGGSKDSIGGGLRESIGGT